MIMTPWVLRLIIANVVMYFLTTASPALMSALTFVPAYVLFRPWTLVTYMFLHVGFQHIFFNMLGLFFFGPRLEMELGSNKFLMLYFVSGITGALVSFAFSPMTQIVGASGGVFGVELGFAYFWPRMPIYIWGVIPIEARWLVVGMTILSIYGGMGFAMNGVAHFAHLGGFLGAYIYLKLFYKRYEPAAPAVQRPPDVRPEDVDRWSKIQREKLHIVNREELDRIMNKMNTSGVQSLTATERAFLERFSAQD